MSRAARRRAAPLAPGTTLADRYALLEKLGEGGMAEVYRAQDLHTGRFVAVKVLHRDIATNPEAVERTKREGQVLSELSNPAIVSMQDFGELEDGTVFLVMELLLGETLGARMRLGPMDPVELAPIVAGMCAGLHAAHARRIVHRDLKPDNVFLCPTDHGLQVKLLDFGISKVTGGDKLTQTGEVLGTPRYMSPEQLGAEHDVDARVDVYALGVILYEALTGRPPFLAVTPTELIIAIVHGKVVPLRSVRADVSPAVEAVVMRALSKVRDARFDTAMKLAEAYIDAVGGAAAVRGQQRRGMATVAFGGMRLDAPSAPAMPETRPPPPPSAAGERLASEGAVAGKLRLGTFSGLAETQLPAAAATSPAREGTLVMGEARGAPIPRAPGAALPARPVAEEWGPPSKPAAPPSKSSRPVPITRESPLELPSEAPAAASQPAAAPARPAGEPQRRAIPATALMDASDVASLAGMGAAPGTASVAPSVAPSRRTSGTASASMSAPSFVLEPAPTRGRSAALLVVGALLAGALSAAAVIAALTWHDQQRDDEDTIDDEPTHPVAPAPIAPLAPRSGPATQPANAPQPRGAPGPSATPQAGTTVPPVAPAALAPSRATPANEPATTTTPRRPSTTTAPRTEAPTTPADPNDPLQALRNAQEALRNGDPARCVEILDEAIRSGAPAVSLRRRADCYEAAGQRSAAINDYQRFCRLVPDHPAISEVRPLLESWGRTCP